MIWMMLLLVGNTLHLKSGETLSNVSYKISGERVLILLGEKLTTLNKADVDWIRTKSKTTSSIEGVKPRIETLESGEKPLATGPIINIDVRQVSLIDLLRFLADEVGFNLYIDSSVKDVKVTYRLKNLPWQTVLEIILRNANLMGEFQGTVYEVGKY